ncbi:MAG: NAD(P)-dependent alcohol dehydrogenase [Desulfobacteraceae bacterium]|nr:NAD(P)-dependent alcohol dehydrogenase [Desulfobacteraceae bacterium]
MRAIAINRFGASDVLEIMSDFPDPAISGNQVLIKVHSAGVNPLDWKIREGQLRFSLGSNFPMILGNDVSGTIVDIGSDVTNFRIGDEVFCLSDASPKRSLTGFAKSGAYAELAVTREDTLSYKPNTVSHQEAASIPLAALTAYQTLQYKARIKKGDKVLINGASGGVGTFAVQIAKALEGKVTAVCGTSNQDLVASLGSDRVIDYRKQKITELNEKYDVIYDVAAVTSFFRCKGLLTKTGIFISNLANPFNLLSTILFPAFRIFGFKKRYTFAWVKSSGDDLKNISQMIDDAKIRGVIDKVYEMEEIREAHDYSQSGLVKGKIIINISKN